ncbi:hypothetical protein, partial, partial [Absidia glauca]
MASQSSDVASASQSSDLIMASQSSMSSIGMSSLQVAGGSEFLSPGNHIDTSDLLVPKGYAKLVEPQITIMATNIQVMHDDNRVKFVLEKAISVLLNIYIAPKREDLRRKRMT